MKNRTLIFQSVMTELIESFTPFMTDFFRSFQAQYTTADNKKIIIIFDGNQDFSNVDKNFFEDFFNHFPRKIPFYKEMIQKLCLLASSDVDGTIHYLTKLIKEVINGKPTKQFTLLQMTKTFPDLSNKVNYILFFYISNIFIADLICQIMVNYYAKTSNSSAKNNSSMKDNDENQISPDVITFLTRTAYSIASTKHELPNTDLLVLRQWSVILSLLSEYDFNNVTQVFSMFQNSNDITNALVLMQYVRFDINTTFGSIFFDTIIQAVRTHIRKKTITNAGLEAVSKMIVTYPFNEEIFTKLYQTVRPLRKDKNMKHLWPGSVILSCSLFLRLPSKRNRSKFLQKQVIGSCTDIKKLETSLKCFSMMIIGRNTDIFWENWEWGLNPRADKYTYLRLNSACDIAQDDPRSFTNIFMSNYFVKSPFYMYPKIVKRILLHLASLDFVYFTNFVVPQFVELNSDDPRFSTFLKIVPKVNSQDFWDHIFKAPNNYEDQLKKFNKSLHQKVLSTLRLCASNMNAKSDTENEKDNEFGGCNTICFHDKDLMIDSILSEADQKVASILEEWKISSNFNPKRVHFKFAKFPKNKYSLIDSLFPTLKFVLDDNDFNNTTMMDIFIGCSYYNDSIVSTTSYDICKNVIPFQSNCESFFQMLIVTITTNENYESVYTCLSIIESSLSSLRVSYDDSLSTDSSNEREELSIDCSISKKLLIDIEVMAFLVLSFEHPAIRHLGYAVLNIVNEIFCCRGLLSYLKKNFKRIEKDAKDHIFLQSELVNYDDKLSNQNTMNSMKSTSTTRIPFETAILSHYYDVWIFYVTSMMNVLIEVNYQPFFKHIKIISPSFTPVIFDYRSIREGDMTALIIMLSSMFYPRAIINCDRYKSKTLLVDQQYEPYNLNEISDERPTVCAFIAKLLSDDYEDSYSEIGFHIIAHLHFSILGPLIDVLSNVPQKKLPRATQTLSLILRLPEIDNYFIHHNFHRITSFINTINTYLLENQLNTPRIMEWTKNQIKSLLSNVLLAFDYCNIIYTTFRCSKVLKDDSWPITTREVVFRFLVNWAIAAYNISDNEINLLYKSPSHSHSNNSLNSFENSNENFKINNWWKNIINKYDSSVLLCNLREYAKLALITLCKVGPMFTHTPLFDDLSVRFLGGIELSGLPILTNIINFHFDIIIDDYIKACYTQPTSISEAFFDAIVNNIKPEHGDSLVSRSGELLLLAMIFGQRDHTRAHELIDRFLDIAVDHDLIILPKAEKNSQNIMNDIVDGILNNLSNLANISTDNSHSLNYSNYGIQLVKNDIHNAAHLLLVPQIFTYAAEAVFKALFTVIEEYNFMSVPFKDVINAARVWTAVIRLLPKRHTCVQVIVPPQFNYFTPYQFLTALAHVTEIIDEDRGKLFFSLWEDLAKAPDHRDIITVYLANMVNSSSMQGIFKKLLEFFPDNVLPLIDERCSFAYFFHCTKCLNEDFNLSSSGWGSNFLCHVFQNNFENILPKLPTILQFVLIFRERGLDAPFRVICRKVGVDCPEGEISSEALRSIVGQIVIAFNSPLYEKFSIERWGNECLKWLFACDDTHLASLSFLIYNAINKPYDHSTFHFQVIKTVSYHIEKYSNEQEKNTQIKKNHEDEAINSNSVSPIHSHSNFNAYLVALRNDLSLLIDESFIFFSKHLDGNDILIYNYISSFLDSQILPHLELIGAIHFFIQAFRQPEILLLVCQNIITLVRPLIPMIEVDRSVQELIDKCVEKIDNEDVKMIVLPIKKAHKNLFPHLPSIDHLIRTVSVNGMCNALVHYAVMAETSSRPVLDSIFEISTTIVNKVTDENNSNPLTHLYHLALRSLSSCPSAFTFVREVSARQPQVASNETIDSFVWTRSMSDVNRSIQLVLTKMKSGTFDTKSGVSSTSPPPSPLMTLSNSTSSSTLNSQGSSIGDSENDNGFYKLSHSSSNLNEPETTGGSSQSSMKVSKGFSSRLTDCHSYKSVLNFLYLTEEEEERSEDIENEETNEPSKSSHKKVPKLHGSHSPKNPSSKMPRILPFAAQKEMIEGMRKVKTRMKKVTLKNKSSNAHLLSQSSSSMNDEKVDSVMSTIPNSTSIVFNSISQNQPQLRRHSHGGRTKRKSSTKSDTDSDSDDNNERQTVICEPNFATVYGSLIQFPTFGISKGNGADGESLMTNLSPMRHPKKLMLTLPSINQNNDHTNQDEKSSLIVDRNILEEELERSRRPVFSNNLSAKEFFKDGLVRRRSSAAVIIT